MAINIEGMCVYERAHDLKTTAALDADIAKGIYLHVCNGVAR